MAWLVVGWNAMETAQAGFSLGAVTARGAKNVFVLGAKNVNN